MRCRLVLAAALAAVVAACATRIPPPLPAALAYPEFMYPAVPPPLASADAGRSAIGWRFLQNDDLGNADREFTAALQRAPALYPARTGAAYVALARRDYDRALTAFDAVLRAAPEYVPALVGRGQSLLALRRDAAALEAFEAALAADASLADVRRRIDVLRFRNLQDVIEAARAAAAAGRLDEARSAYERALNASPDSAFLQRELGLVERQQGSTQGALERFRRAIDLDPGDAVSLIQRGELLDEQQDFAGAEASYRRAAEIEPSADLRQRIAALAEKARAARLPAEFRAIPASDPITRGELAALLGVRLEDALRTALVREVVMTDTQGDWAAVWIGQVARTGVMEGFANHTFQPRARVTRGDLATAVSRVVALIAANRPDLRPRLTERPNMTDLAAGHLDYPAASIAVASGVMPLLDAGRFNVGRSVSGAEATEVIARLRALADGSR